MVDSIHHHTKLEIINRDGWRKEYPLGKEIIHIGSDATNDIVLDNRYGTGVAPLHAQLIMSVNGKTIYKLVNLGNTDIAIKAGSPNTLPPLSVMDLSDGLQFMLGEFTVIFHSASRHNTGANITSRSIGLKLVLPDIHLPPNGVLKGMVVVSNRGRRSGVRFDLTLEGMDPACYEIAPGPLLSSGAEKEVPFYLRHLGNKPIAGEWRIVIRATAPRDYPEEQAMVSQIIHVLPYYRHQLRLLPGEGITPLSIEEKAKEKAGPTHSQNTTSQSSPDFFSDTGDVRQAIPPKARPSLPRKVAEPATATPETGTVTIPKTGQTEPPPDTTVVLPAEPELPARQTPPTSTLNVDAVEPAEAGTAQTPSGQITASQHNTDAVEPAEINTVQTGVANEWDDATEASLPPTKPLKTIKLKANLLPEKQLPPGEVVADEWDDATEAPLPPAKPLKTIKLKANLLPEKQLPPEEKETEW